MKTVELKPMIKKGDMVQVIAGRKKGKPGKVKAILAGSGRIVIEGLHLVRRNSKPTQKNPQGGVVEKEASIAFSNVLLMCPACNRGVRTGRRFDDGSWVRVCKKCSGKV